MNEYLYELGREREREAIHRFFDGPLFGWICEKLNLNIHWPYSWVVIMNQNDTLITRENVNKYKLRGETDILCGPLIKFNNQEGYIDWQPDFTYIAGIEVKALWFSKEQKLKSTKSGRLSQFYQKSMRLVRLGCNHSWVIHVIATEPLNFGDFHTWFAATIQANDGSNKFREILAPKIITEGPIGVAVIPWGAIPGGKTEQYSGVFTSEVIKSANDKHCLKNLGVTKVRKCLTDTITNVINQNIKPDRPPYYVLTCKKCKSLFLSGSPYQHDGSACLHPV